MEYKSFLELVKQRRSIRRFKSDPIPDEHVDKIIEAARWAPSGANTQPWEFIIIKKKELKESIVQFVNEYRLTHTNKMAHAREAWQKDRPFAVKKMQNWLHSDWSIAPVFILLCGDIRTKAGLPMHVRYLDQKRESIFTSSLASAFLCMTMAATTLDLASVWVSAVQAPLVHCQIKDLLGIPEPLKAYDMMVVGHPDSKAKPKFMRAKDSMVHYDDCGPQDFRTDEEVRDFIRKTRTWIISTIQSD